MSADEAGLYTYRATVARIYDADTMTAGVDCGWRITVTVQVRLHGINARELRDPGGKEARDHLATLCPPGSTVLLRSVELDKYGRSLGRLTLPDGRDVAATMVADGYAVRWDGRGDRPVPPWPLHAETPPSSAA